VVEWMTCQLFLLLNTITLLLNSKCLTLYSYNDKRIDHGNSLCKGLSIKLSLCGKELKRIIVVNSLGFPAVFVAAWLNGGLAGLPAYGMFDPILIMEF